MLKYFFVIKISIDVGYKKNVEKKILKMASEEDLKSDTESESDTDSDSEDGRKRISSRLQGRSFFIVQKNLENNY